MNHSSVDDLGIIPISHHIINQTGITNLCNCCNIFAGCVHVVVASYILWLSHKTELCVVCLAMFLWICDMVGLLRKTFHVMVFSPNRVPWLWHAIAVSLPHQAPYGQLTPSDCVFVCILPLIITKHITGVEHIRWNIWRSQCMRIVRYCVFIGIIFHVPESFVSPYSVKLCRLMPG